MCPRHREAKQYQNISVWNRERFIEGHVRRQVVHTLKNPKSPKALSKKPFSSKALGETWLVVANFLVSEVRSCSGNDVPVNLQLVMLSSVLTRKGMVPRHNLPLEVPVPVPVPARRRQVSAGSSLRASPQTLPSCHC